MKSRLRMCRGLLRCGGSESGSVILEHLLLLGILVSSAAGIYLLVRNVNRVLSAAGQRCEGDAAVARSSDAACDSGTTVHSDAGGTLAVAFLGYAGAVLLGGVVALAITWQARRCRHRARPAREDDEDDEIQPDEFQVQLYRKRQQLLRLLGHDGDVLLKNRLAVRHLMTCQAVTTVPSATYDEMTALMSQKRVRHLLVCDAGGRLLGVVSDRDLRCSRGKNARHVMSAPPRTVAPATPLSPAITYMIRHGFSCLPVLDEGRLCGILTTTDLILALQSSLQYLLRAASVVGRDASWDEPPDGCDELTAVQV